MSLQADRQAIATALDAVSDITGYPDPADALMAPGDAWARWTGLEAQGTRLIFRGSWEIVIVTGGTPGDALAFLDDHLDQLLDALDQLVFITGARPATIQTPNGDLYGVVITAEKES